MTFVGRRGATDALGRMQREKEEEEGVKCSLTNLLGSRKSVLLSLPLSSLPSPSPGSSSRGLYCLICLRCRIFEFRWRPGATGDLHVG